LRGAGTGPGSKGNPAPGQSDVSDQIAGRLHRRSNTKPALWKCFGVRRPWTENPVGAPMPSQYAAKSSHGAY